MSQTERDEMISQFMTFTGITEDRAKFYLESSAWKIDIALESFYENDGEQNADDLEGFVESSGQIETSGSGTGNTPTDTKSPPTGTSATSISKAQKSKPIRSTNSRFVTVHSLNQATGGNSGGSDEEEGQAFYAGGSEHSGQQVLGPGKKKDIVEEMFKSVQEHGAEVVETNDKRGNKIFSGTGYKLGQSSNDSEVVTPVASTTQAPSDVVLKLWREGFSLNDGPIRAYQDPENREFLDSVRRGEIPHELIREARGSEVHLNMEDHRHEEFVSVKPKLRPFSGAGHTLGSPAPPIAVADVAGTTSNNDSVDNQKSNEQSAKEQVPVDTNKPTTNIQIRLADGSRLLGQFNHFHTIDDVRRYIVLARPQYESREFTLLTTFPSRELSEGTQTLDAAGILNAAVLQRLK